MWPKISKFVMLKNIDVNIEGISNCKSDFLDRLEAVGSIALQETHASSDENLWKRGQILQLAVA
jgi:hypothetical protein